jgi:hypothetical protein
MFIKTTKRLMSSVTLVVSLTLVVPVVSTVTGGCGGSKAASSATRLATINLMVEWPDRQVSRLIPYASESIKVTVTNSSGFVKSLVLVRPTATLLMGDLPPGELQVQAVAYPTANPGDDVAQAVATQMVTAVADQVFDLALTLASTVDHVAIGSSVTKLRKGEETTMSVSAYDSSNRLVLTSPETWRWSTSNPAVLTVGSATQPGYVFATSKGNASVQVLESESGKTASFMLDVVSPLPQLSLTGPATEQLVGQESMLSWTAMDASSVISSNFGASTTSGNIAVSPKVTTTYTLKVANDQSEAIEKSVVLRVAAVSVTVTPTNGVVDIGKTLQLSASVNGAADTGVSWSVVDAGGGKVTATGLYTAPLTQGTYRVKATSSADPSKSATCDVRVRAAGGSIIIN